MIRKLLKLWTNPRAIVRQILALDDSAHHIALGTTLGMFIGLTPTVGVQMIIVGLIAFTVGRWIHFNKAAALLTVYITNPLTVVPIYYGLYRFGTWFVAGDVPRQQFQQVLHFEGFDGWWEAVRVLFMTVGTPLLVGSLIVATIASAITYPIMIALVHWVRGKPPKSGDNNSDAKSDNATDTSDQVRQAVATVAI